MAISGLTPVTALPNAAQLTSGVPLGADLAPQEQPGVFSRIGSALKAAVSAFRGDVPTDAALGAQTLGMQVAPTASAPLASAPVTVKKASSSGSGSATKKAAATAKHPKAKTWVDKQGNVRQVGTGKVLKAAAGARSGASAAAAAALPAPTTQLPSNATQVPGATVYSYDQNGNPVTMAQLGMSPSMLQGLTGLAGAADQATAVPQVNATNQNSIGLGSTGTATPVLGQPILVADESSAAAATSSQPANQTVRNENSTDIASRNQGVDYGYGSGFGTGGIATPYSPYGASMTGAYALGTNPASRWF